MLKTGLPDGRNHYFRLNAVGSKVLIWDGDGEPHAEAFTAACCVPMLAGMPNVRFPAVSGRISNHLSRWCLDRALPMARIDGGRLFPVAAILAWLDAEGRALIGQWCAGGNVVPFARR